MQGNGYTLELEVMLEGRAREWCQKMFGPENPNVWSTLEPGWSIRYKRAHFTNKQQMEMFMITWC